MQVQFLKDHLPYKTGDIAEVTDERGNYFILCHVAEKVEVKAKKEKVEFKPAKEKKEDGKL